MVNMYSVSLIVGLHIINAFLCEDIDDIMIHAHKWMNYLTTRSTVPAGHPTSFVVNIPLSWLQPSIFEGAIANFWQESPWTPSDQIIISRQT